MLAAAERGNVRAAAWLLDRLVPEFSMPAWRGKSQRNFEIPAHDATITIRGGLPTAGEIAERKGNGHDPTPDS
jgi:hypothetical protein